MSEQDIEVIEDAEEMLETPEEISEDEQNREQNTIQKLTDRFINEIETIKSDKEKDLLEL